MSNPAALPFVLDPQICERARMSRDARFDGLFYTAVTSTRIYCRSVCPAPTPKPQHIRYYATAAAAASAGFRPCLRCRPEVAPGSPLHRAGGELVRQALHLIEDGVLDDASVGALAARIGVGERHLRRLFVEQLGASPLEIAATRRVLFAKKLLSETTLPVTEIALASGFASVRRFNAAFQAAYRMPPRVVRRKEGVVADGLTLRLPYRPPYDFAAQLAFYARRAIPRVEQVDAVAYRRAFMHDGIIGSFDVQAASDENALLLCIQFPNSSVLPMLSTRVRRMFDLDADPVAINTALAQSEVLHALVQKHPGQRLPGAWDGFETAVRAVLGQQISVAAARTFAARLVERFGERLLYETASGLSALFPTPQSLCDADIASIGLPKARAKTLRELTHAVCAGQLHFAPNQTLDNFVESMVRLPGIGAWTAHYVAMRALLHPDAFPAADLILRRAAASDGVALSTKALEQLSQIWRPWRAYAVLHLWRSQG